MSSLQSLARYRFQIEKRKQELLQDLSKLGDFDSGAEIANDPMINYWYKLAEQLFYPPQLSFSPRQNTKNLLR